jgi:hypothetical protein
MPYRCSADRVAKVARSHRADVRQRLVREVGQPGEPALEVRGDARARGPTTGSSRREGSMRAGFSAQQFAQAAMSGSP